MNQEMDNKMSETKERGRKKIRAKRPKTVTKLNNRE